MGFRIQRQGFTKVAAMASMIAKDLMDNGFDVIYPSAAPENAKSIILKAGADVDPLHATQPWCIKLMWDKDAAGQAITETTTGGKLDIIVATPLQFNAETGAHAVYDRYNGTSSSSNNVGVSFDVVGLIGTAVYRGYPSGFQGWKGGFPDRTFIDRSRLKIGADGDETLAYPMSYHLVITPRGFTLVVWEQGTDNVANRYSYLVVQRPVDNVTGEVITTGRAPVHCLYGLMSNIPNQPWSDSGNYNFRRFIVREDDVHVPYPLASISTQWPKVDSDMMGVDATRHTKDYAAILNAAQQVSISENNKYVVTFPNGLNTARYAYTHELDLIAYTSADVVSQGTEIPLQVYGEETPRKYLALNANGPNNTGMRLLVLVEGGGV